MITFFERVLQTQDIYISYRDRIALPSRLQRCIDGNVIYLGILPDSLHFYVFESRGFASIYKVEHLTFVQTAVELLMYLHYKANDMILICVAVMSDGYLKVYLRDDRIVLLFKGEIPCYLKHPGDKTLARRIGLL